MAYNSSLTSEQVEQKLLGILAKDNTEEYTPSGDYNPATKKYVDDNAGLKNYRILTESEYSALGESVLTDNILYFVTPDD